MKEGGGREEEEGRREGEEGGRECLFKDLKMNIRRKESEMKTSVNRQTNKIQCKKQDRELSLSNLAWKMAENKQAYVIPLRTVSLRL